VGVPPYVRARTPAPGAASPARHPGTVLSRDSISNGAERSPGVRTATASDESVCRAHGRERCAPIPRAAPGAIAHFVGRPLLPWAGGAFGNDQFNALRTGTEADFRWLARDGGTVGCVKEDDFVLPRL
jgi:hypothetical protein